MIYTNNRDRKEISQIYILFPLPTLMDSSRSLTACFMANLNSLYAPTRHVLPRFDERQLCLEHLLNVGLTSYDFFFLEEHF